MGISVGGGDGIKSEPNVVPMIDIMLVLLIIFMIVTPVIAAGFQADMPMARNIEARQEEPEDVVLGIDKEGKYYLDPGTGSISFVPPDSLGSFLRQIYDVRMKDKVMYFRADKNLDYGVVQEAIEIARAAGVRVLAAITEQSREGAGILGAVGR
ncbi:MAG TPA: biopolymer transporter ExbD [Gemmatimonadales bacterium]|jgi:biopolymer transport protein ExbD